MQDSSDEVGEKVIKDMSEKYNSDVGEIQDEINILKKQILIQPDFIINLMERIHALYIKLNQKMTPNEIKIQNKFRKDISKINLFKYKRILDEYGNVTNQRMIYQSEFIKLKSLLERREIYLNKSLERVGLTSKQKKEKRRIV